MGAGHDHSHGHSHTAGANERSLMIALALTTTFLVVELVAGVLTQSLALISDAAHMFTDTAALAQRIRRAVAAAPKRAGVHGAGGSMSAAASLQTRAAGGKREF